jgi:serine/threonine-protein kinase HipA
VPTTHILKPAVTGLDDHDLNEHLCLTAARLLGLYAASSRVASFGAERVIVLERYDRHRTPTGTIARVHLEDICQALGVLPTSKYQNERGPTPELIVELLRRTVLPPSAAAENVDRFVDALAFNWVIGGTDAHAKNYSVLLAGSQVRLAPLYDVATALVYEDMYLPRLRMAMKIGGEYGLEAAAVRHWRRFATENLLDVDELVARIDGLAERVPDAFASAAKDKDVRGLKSRLPASVVDRVAVRAAKCRKSLRP